MSSFEAKVKSNSNVYHDDESEVYSIHEEELTTKVSEIKTDDDSCFYVSFSDGSTFKTMIEVQRLNGDIAILRFTKNGITCQQTNKDETMIFNINIKPYKLTEYDFISKTDEIIVPINLPKLRGITKNVNKKDQFDIYRLQGEPSTIYARIRSQGDPGNGEVYCLPVAKVDEIYNMVFPDYDMGKYNPTCVIYQTEFNKLCKSSINVKCNHIRIHGLDKGIIVKGITNDNKIFSVQEFGKVSGRNNKKLKSFKLTSNASVIRAQGPKPVINIAERGEIEQFKIPIKIVRTLVKLNGLAPNGTLRFYIEENQPLKIVCDIGYIGTMEIFLDL